MKIVSLCVDGLHLFIYVLASRKLVINFMLIKSIVKSKEYGIKMTVLNLETILGSKIVLVMVLKDPMKAVRTFDPVLFVVLGQKYSFAELLQYFCNFFLLTFNEWRNLSQI